MKAFRITVRKVCWAETFVLLFVGVIAHSVYTWSGELRWVAALFPVNESVWEHLKLGWIGVVLLSLVEYSFVRTQVSNFWFAKFISLLVIELIILLVFYSYSAVTHHPILVFDISCFVLGVFMGQWIVCRLYTSREIRFGKAMGVSGLLLTSALFIIYTYYPPRLPIFKDGNNDSYGIDRKN